MMDQFVEGDVSVEDHSKTFKWKINDFLVQMENISLYQKFSMLETDGKIKDWWGCLGLRFGMNDKNEIRFMLVRNKEYSDNLGSFNISILNDKHLKKCKREANGISQTRCSVKINHFIDFNLLKENAITLLPGGALTLFLEFKKHSLQGSQNLPRNNLPNDLNEAFTGMNHSDCVIHCGEDQKLVCHSFMLEARSPVFKAMLGSGFQVRWFDL
jgi:hypothetical protein